MIVKQLSVKMVNKPGELSRVSDLLGDEGVNLRALTASVHGKDAQIHLIPDDPEKALEVLRARDYDVAERDVIAVETPDHPGGLNAILRPLKEAQINVEFLYPVIGRHHRNAVLIVGAEPLDKAIEALRKYYIKILDRELESL